MAVAVLISGVSLCIHETRRLNLLGSNGTKTKRGRSACPVGLVVGKINDISSDEENKFFDLLMQHTKAYDFPILTQVDIGHTDPKITMPIGLMVTLDSATSLFSFDEPAVINC
jgi:hypothetical protein